VSGTGDGTVVDRVLGGRAIVGAGVYQVGPSDVEKLCTSTVTQP
jgi:hypothetical protein